jgi:cytochrome bd-type quinol oxidase subunit 2
MMRERGQAGHMQEIRTPVRDTIRYWEMHRIWYNVALLLLVVAWVVFTWPHFRPAFNARDFGRTLILAAIANLCYSSAYLIDLPLQSAAGDAWRRRRWILWLLGTLLAVLFACYWIADEIYPYVGPV